MQRRQALTVSAWVAAFGAIMTGLKQGSDIVKDQAQVWGNIGWAAEEITQLKERIAKLENR